MKTKIKVKKSGTADAQPEGSYLVYVPLDALIKHPDIKYRGEKDDWTDTLSHDIAANGLDYPPLTWGGGETQEQVNVGGEKTPAYYILAGEQRVGALKKFRENKPTEFKKTFPNGVPVFHRLGTLEDAHCAVLRTNIQKEDMQPHEIFPILESLIDGGMKQSVIARKLGKTRAWVSQMVTIQEELPEEIKEEVIAGDVPLADARAIAGEAKKAKKAGKPLSKQEIKAKTESAKAARATQVTEKRFSTRALYEAFKKLPSMPLGRQVTILCNVIEYSLKDANRVESELLKILSKKPEKPAAKKTDKPTKKSAKSKAAALPARKKKKVK